MDLDWELPKRFSELIDRKYTYELNSDDMKLFDLITNLYQNKDDRSLSEIQEHLQELRNIIDAYKACTREYSPWSFKELKLQLKVLLKILELLHIGDDVKWSISRILVKY